MGLFSLTQEIAIDLGTANTVIIQNDKIVVDQPSIVAINNKTDKVVAIGANAHRMHGKTSPDIRTIRPLKDGVIADFDSAEKMIRGLIKMIPKKGHLFSPTVRMVIGIPSGSTPVEMRAVRDSAEHAGGRDIYMIYEPMAAALGIGLDVEAPEGNMVVDIGGGTTEIAVISLGGIVIDQSIRVAGDEFTKEIIEHMNSVHNIRVGETTAENIKKSVGAALTDLGENAPDPYVVKGPNLLTGLPIEVPVSYQEIAHCLNRSIEKIENAVKTALTNTPPELYRDIVENGVYLAGGGALLRGLADRFEAKVGIKFNVADDPLRAVARGTGIALKNVDKFQFLLR